MGFGFRSIIFLSVAGAGTIAGIAIAARNDYNGEKMWKKTKNCIVNFSKSTTKLMPSSQEKSIDKKVDSENKVKQINVVLEDSEIIVANKDNENQEEKIYKLPSINQTFQNISFVSYLYFIDGSLDNLKLRKTLEELLNSYQILSGRLSRNKKNETLEVKLNNKGVFFSIVKYSDTMSNILPEIKNFSLAPNCSNLYGQNYSIEQCIKTSIPMIQIRITHFSDDKTCISIRSPSFITDLASITKFVQDWSCLYRGEPLNVDTIFNSNWITDYISTHNLEKTKNLTNYQPLAFAKVGCIDWIKLAIKTIWEWIAGGGFQTRSFYISDKQLEELRNQVIADAKLANENEEASPTGSHNSKAMNSSPTTTPTTPTAAPMNEDTTNTPTTTSPTTQSTKDDVNTNIDWISTKDVLIAHIWKKIATIPRNISYSNRVFKNCNARLFIDGKIENVFGNMNISAVTPLTYITLLSPLYYLSQKIHTSMSNLPIQLPNLLTWINSQKEEELPLINVPVNYFGKQTDLLFNDADIDTSKIKFSNQENVGNVLWLYQESKPSIPNIVTIVKTSKLTEPENVKGYYIYVTLSRIDMNGLIKQGGL